MKLKRLVSLILSAVLMITALGFAASAADTGGFAVSRVDSFSVYASDEYTRAVHSDSVGESSITALKELLGGAGKSVSAPSNATAVATLRVVAGESAVDYKLLRAASGDKYYLQRGTVYRPVEYSAFEKIFSAKEFYTYYDIPAATVDGEALSVSKHTYSYRQLNGRFKRRASINSSKMPVLYDSNGLLKTPKFERMPRGIQYEVTPDNAKAGEKSWTGSAAEAKNYKPGDGKYTVTITATYDNDDYRGDVVYAYRWEGMPDIHFDVEADYAQPGEVVLLRVSGTDAAKAMATATTDVNFKPQFFRQDANNQIALLPVSVYTGAGEHWVEITCGSHKKKITFTVQNKEFVVQNLTVAQSTAQETILSQKANQEYEKVIAPLRTVSDDHQYWSGRFMIPASDKKVTSAFGMIRYVNGSTTPTRHNALDLAVPLGTDVKATEAGRVLYAGYLQLTGNTVLIEHGYGLKSWYYHMDSLGVATDDVIKEGHVIGTVGSTGFSTGPHLHFGMSVNNVFINPYTLINTDHLAG